jgi:DNA-binding IclR family transcriptional regulator
MRHAHTAAQSVSAGDARLSSAHVVDRVFAVLGAVAADAGGATVTQVVARTRLPKSTVSRLLLSLERLTMLERTPEGRAYRIGRGMLALLAQVPRTEGLSALAQPMLQTLHDELGETVALTLPDGDNAYIAVQINSNHAIQTRDWTGLRIPMYAQSTGRVFLAARTDHALKRYLTTPRAPFTARTRVSPAQLRSALQVVRSQGYAWVFEEYEDGLVAVAAPVRDAAGDVIAAISAFGPSFRFPGARQQQTVTRRVVAAAQALTARLQAQAARGV